MAEKRRRTAAKTEEPQPRARAKRPDSPQPGAASGSLGRPNTRRDRRGIPDGRRRTISGEAHRRRAGARRSTLLHGRSRSAARGARLAGCAWRRRVRSGHGRSGQRCMDRGIHAARPRTVSIYGVRVGGSFRVLAQGTRAARGAQRHSHRPAGGQHTRFRGRRPRLRRRRRRPESLVRSAAGNRRSRRRRSRSDRAQSA